MAVPQIFQVDDHLAVVVRDDPDGEVVSVQDEAIAPWPYSRPLVSLTARAARALALVLAEAAVAAEECPTG
jgi:hypothetical protein